jgi:hypothetical protein
MASLRLGPYLTSEAEAEVALDHQQDAIAAGIEIKLASGGKAISTARMNAWIFLAEGRRIESTAGAVTASHTTFRASIPVSWLCESSESGIPLRIVFDLKDSRDPASALPTLLHPRQLDRGADLIASACPAAGEPSTQ